LYADLKDDRDCRGITRNGYLPEREIQTGVGPVHVRTPRARDRKSGEEENRSTELPIHETCNFHVMNAVFGNIELLVNNPFLISLSVTFCCLSQFCAQIYSK